MREIIRPTEAILDEGREKGEIREAGRCCWRLGKNAVRRPPISQAECTEAA